MCSSRGKGACSARHSWLSPPAHTPVNVFLTDGTGLQSLADAASKWRRELRLMVVWCITSVVALLSGGILSLSAVSAVIGVACSLRFLYRINQPTPARDIAASVKVCMSLNPGMLDLTWPEPFQAFGAFKKNLVRHQQAGTCGVVLRELMLQHSTMTKTNKSHLGGKQNFNYPGSFASIL